MAEDSALAVPALIVGLNGRYITFMFIGVTAYNLFCGRWSRRRAGSVGTALFAMFVAGTLAGPDLRVWKIATLVSFSFSIGLAWFCAFYVLRDRLPFTPAIDFLADISYPFYALHYVVGFTLLTVMYDLYPSAYLALPVTLVSSPPSPTSCTATSNGRLTASASRRAPARPGADRIGRRHGGDPQLRPGRPGP